MRFLLIAVLWSWPVQLSLAQAKTALGTIEAVDAAVGNITLLVPPKHDAKQFSLARPDLPITNVLGQPLKLADLKKKQRVVLQLDAMEDVIAIRQEEDCRWAHVLKVLPQERQLLVKTGYLEYPLSIPADVPVLIDGQKAGLADLKVGKGIKAIFTPGQRELLQIQAGKGIAGTNPYCRWMALTGILLKVDHERKTMQILNPTGRFETHDYEYETWGILKLGHSSYHLRTTDMTRLQPFCKITFYAESDTLKVVLVKAEVPTLVRKMVTAVDGPARQLTIQTDDKTTLRLPVAPDALIRKPNGLARWEEADKGMVTCGLSLDGKEILYLYLWDK